MEKTTSILIIAILVIAGAGGAYALSQQEGSSSDPVNPPEKVYADGIVVTHSYKQDNQMWAGAGWVEAAAGYTREFRPDGSAIGLFDEDFYGDLSGSYQWTIHVATLKITPEEDFTFDIDKIRMVLYIKQDVLFGPTISQMLISPAYPTDILAGDEVSITIYIVYPNVISGITLYYDSVEIEYVPDT